MLEAAEGADELPQKRRVVDAADHEQHRERCKAERQDRAAPVRHRGDQTGNVPSAQQADRQRREAQRCRRHHKSEAGQQHEEQPGKQIGEAQAGNGKSFAAADFLCRVSTFKLRSQFLRAAELGGDLLFRISVGQLEREMLFVLLGHVGGVRYISLVQLRSQPRHKFMLCHCSHPPIMF